MVSANFLCFINKVIWSLNVYTNYTFSYKRTCRLGERGGRGVEGLNEVEGRGWGTSMGRGRGKWHSYRKFIGNQPAFKKKDTSPRHNRCLWYWNYDYINPHLPNPTRMVLIWLFPLEIKLYERKKKKKNYVESSLSSMFRFKINQKLLSSLYEKRSALFAKWGKTIQKKFCKMCII